MAYADRTNRTKHPFLWALFFMLMVVALALSMLTNNPVWYKLIKWLCAGIVIVGLALGFKSIFRDSKHI